MLVVAVAGRVTGESVAAGVAGAALIPDLEKRWTEDGLWVTPCPPKTLDYSWD